MDSGGHTDPPADDTARADGSGHHVPDGQAPEEYGDHRGHGDQGEPEHNHRSRWPFIAAAGAAALYVGFALFIFGAETELVPRPLGIGLAVVGAAALLAGIGGWLNQAFLAPARERQEPHKSRGSYISTTMLFLTTDVSTFGGLFIYYFFIRVGTWPAAELPPLLGSLVVINTALLVTSSITLHYAHESLGHGNRRRFLTLLCATLALGIVFLAGQAYEYYEFITAEGFSLTSGIFGSAFFGLTGLHGFHVALGIGGIAILCWRALRGYYGPDRDTSIATVSLYWHFVDAVWLFLVVVLYVGASI
ncbi:cytochrome c oxidase subunit 3 [Natrialba aegyptia]|uniref:Cytochrome c oxidase subunit III n=1 Tax=Natrialba aegyptia DSM 13077 TaxID=1227491 RepID=M0B089_9EURY|nr:heme-copper oxidase subunit III [Natrialba aegyptia]ELZ03089.1 cytochrome c oxidase subunit III [Natrialba aegyptia DSM 13077]